MSLSSMMPWTNSSCVGLAGDMSFGTACCKTTSHRWKQDAFLMERQAKHRKSRFHQSSYESGSCGYIEGGIERIYIHFTLRHHERIKWQTFFGAILLIQRNLD